MLGQVLDKSRGEIRREKGILTFVVLALMAIVLLGTQTEKAHAGTTVELRESYAGNMSFELTGGSFRTTQNDTSACIYTNTSSNALSSLPIGATIEKAYLYWAASSAASWDTDNQVKLNGIDIYADRIYTEDTGSWDFFSGVADVTSLIQTYGNTTYTVTELDIYSTSSHCQSETTLGGWALMVIYSADNEDFRVLNVYEGFQSFQNTSVTLVPNNFKLPSNPSGKHAHVTWEGDDTLGTDGEYLSFEGNLLTDSGNPGNNQFNSYSNVQGGFTSYGVDIDEYDISSYLTAGATQVSTTYSAGQDLVLLSAEIVSVSNIPVADLSVTTSNPTGWQQGSTVTKKFTISNNGPNDVPAQSVEFTTTLPAELSFSGVQGDSDWNCLQSGQTLTCRYQPKLRAGWSDYLDLTFDVANNTAPGTANLSVSVNHENAPYDIFDNQVANDTYQFNVPIVSVPVVDLSASSKTYTNLSGDLLLAGDTLQYVITIDDASDLNVSNIRVTDNLPANISGYSIISYPSGASNNSTTSGGTNGTGYLDISNISLAAGATDQIVLEVYVNSGASRGASLQNTATITEGSSNWIVDTGDITVVEPNLSPSTIEAIDKTGGLLTAGDTVSVIVTLDDQYDLDISDLIATMSLPTAADGYTVTSFPDGSIDASGSTVEIQNISFLSGETTQIEFDFTIDSSAVDGTQLPINAVLTIGSLNWNIAGPTLTVTNSSPSANGNKQLYLSSTNNMGRQIPSDGELDITDEGSETWTLTPALNADLTFSLTDISVELFLEGNRWSGSTPDLDIELYRSSDDLLLASRTVFGFSLFRGSIDLLEQTLSKNNSISEDEITLNAGDSLYLRIYSSDGGSSSQNNRRTTVHVFDTNDSSKKANGYSAVILNASTVVNVDKVEFFSTPFIDSNSDYVDDSGAVIISASQPDTTLSVRATISDPFGAFDISSANITMTKSDGTPVFNNDSMWTIDDPNDDFSTHTKTFEQTFTLAETDEITGYWTINVTGFEGSEGDVDHTQVVSFQVNPFLPNITLSKSIEVTNDPINGTTNPKAIPGAELKYSIFAKNSGRGSADDGSIILTDQVPDNSELFVGNITCSGNAGPICFIDGVPPNNSGLSFTFINIDDATDDLEFSIDGSDYSYVPDDADGDGYDPAIRYLRIKPQGSLNASDKTVSFEPEFNFEFQIRLQ